MNYIVAKEYFTLLTTRMHRVVLGFQARSIPDQTLLSSHCKTSGWKVDLKVMKNKSGFTIVELLIVIVVIAILAAISIVAYNGIQDRANASTAQTDLASFKKKIELVRVDASDGLYPSTLTPEMGFKFTKSIYKVDRNNLYYCPSTDRTQYAFGVVLKKANSEGFMITPAGVIVAHNNVGDATTCGQVGLPSGTRMGHYDTGVWQSWTN